MKTLVVVLLLLICACAESFAGNCDFPDDRAADGSRCGGRSAWSRPGGK